MTTARSGYTGATVRDSAFGDTANDYGRLVEMVLAAEDFGLERGEACGVARAALERPNAASDVFDAVAGALAERLLQKVREAPVSARHGRA